MQHHGADASERHEKLIDHARVQGVAPFGAMETESHIARWKKAIAEEIEMALAPDAR